MAGKTTAWGANVLAMLFQAVGATGIMQNAASPITELYVSLHTADPGASGTQSTSEAAYAGYARVGVARTTAGWVLTNNSISPAAAVTFPQATGGSETETFFGIGTAATGAGQLLYSGAISPGIVVTNGVTPQLNTSTTVVEA